MQEAGQMGYINVATDATEIVSGLLDDNATTQALRQSLSDLLTAVGNKEQAHSTQQH